MVDLTIQIPQTMHNQLVEYCESIGEEVEDFVFNLVADKLFTELHGDINQALSISQPVKTEEKAVETVTPKVEPQKEEVKVEVKEEPKPAETITIATVEPEPVKVTKKEPSATKKTAVKRTTRTIKTK